MTAPEQQAAPPADLRNPIEAIRAELNRTVHPEWRDVHPIGVLLGEIDQRDAKLAALREQLAAAHAENERLRAERITASWDAFQAATIGLRFHAAYQSARRRANRYAHLLNQRPTS